MKNIVKIISMLLCACLVFSLVACGNGNADEKQSLTIAYQGGIGYADRKSVV